MSRVTVFIPDDLQMKIQNLVDQGEYDTEEDAIVSLLRSGVTAERAQQDQTEEEDEWMHRDYRQEDEYVF